MTGHIARLALCALAALPGLPSIAAAQTTWVVDAAGGPGSQFTTIGAALAAAAEGDTIVVRTGVYTEALVTSKGVHIAADPGVVLANLSYPFESLSVTNIAAGRTFTLTGVAFQVLWPAVIRDCAGAVHIEAVTFPRESVSILNVSNCAQVSLTGCVARGNPSMTIQSSCVALTDCQVDAIGWFANTPAMIIDGGAQVSVVGGTVTGAPEFIDDAEAAIELRDGSLTLAGRDTVVSAGAGLRAIAVPAVRTLGGSVDIDPAVSLITRGGAAGITGPATVTMRRIPAVCSDGLASRGTWVIDLHAPTASPYCLVSSLPMPKLGTPFGTLWANPAASLVLACGAVGPGDQTLLSIPLPALPRGIPIVVQGPVRIAGQVELTTPSVNVIE